MPEGDPLSSLLLTVLLIAVNAFFAMSEIAVITFNDIKLRHLAEEGDKRAKILVNLTEEESKFLSTIQVGVTLAGFFSSAVAADNFTEYVVYWLRDSGIPASTLRSGSLILITLLLSFITLIFGELVPKRIAMNNPEKMSFFAAYPLRIFSFIAAPFVKLLSVTTNLVLRIPAADLPCSGTGQSTAASLPLIRTGYISPSTAALKLPMCSGSCRTLTLC